MPELLIEEQLSRAFKPYVRPASEIHSIRVQIAAYLEFLQPKESGQEASSGPLGIPSHVTGVRRQYLKAIHENLVAQQEYALLKNQLQSQTQSKHDPTVSCEALKTHVNLLKLRKQHQRYQVLLHYISEAEALAERDQVYNIQPAVEQPVPSSADSIIADHLALLAEAQELNRNLEVAVIQANLQLKRERRLLEELKSSGTVPDNPNPAAKLRALAVTQTELNKWVEESLAKCDAVNETNTDDTKKDSRKREPVDYEQMIDERYKEYLEARRQLVEAVSDLRTPLSNSEPVEKDPPNQQSHQKADSRPPKPRSKELSSIFPYLDSKHLPLAEQHQFLNQARSHFKDILSEYNHDLSEQLLRLSEESHLLPSYPILAKTSKSDHESGNVERLLRAWKFAMDAADTAMTATVGKQISVGEKAVDEVENVLDGQKEANDLWKKLDISGA